MLDNLITEWETWCANNNLICMSADDLLFAEKKNLTDEQQSYILDFIARWETAEEIV